MRRTMVMLMMSAALAVVLFPAAASAAGQAEALSIAQPDSLAAQQPESWAAAVLADVSVTPAATVSSQATSAKPMNLYPKFSAYWTNGKGSAYQSYRSPNSPFKDQPIIYKARITGSKLYLWGTYGKNTAEANGARKIYTVKGKSFKLTSKTKYYRHRGNNNFFEKYNKTKMKKLLSGKSKASGGDIGFTVKNGKVTMLYAQ